MDSPRCLLSPYALVCRADYRIGRARIGSGTLAIAARRRDSVTHDSLADGTPRVVLRPLVQGAGSDYA